MEIRNAAREATEIGSFGLAQEETIKLGQTDTDGTLLILLPLHYMMETISVLKLAGLTWHLK